MLMKNAASQLAFAFKVYRVAALVAKRSPLREFSAISRVSRKFVFIRNVLTATCHLDRSRDASDAFFTLPRFSSMRLLFRQRSAANTELKRREIVRIIARARLKECLFAGILTAVRCT